MKITTINISVPRYDGEDYGKSWEEVERFVRKHGKAIVVRRTKPYNYSFLKNYDRPTFNWHGESYSFPMTATSYTAVEVHLPEGVKIPEWI